MKKRPIAAVLLACAASLSIAGSALAFSGVSNGSFETGTFSGAPFDTLASGATNLAGWTVDSGTVDWIGTFWSASDGSRSIDLSGDGPGALSQTIATTVGYTYSVTFDLSGNPGCGPALKTLTVGASGANIQAFSFDIAAAANTHSDMKWEARTYSFVATGSSGTLTFTSTTAGICGPALDNVVVTETAPEPTPNPIPATTSDCKDGAWQQFGDADANGFKNQGDCVSYVATDGKNAGSVTTTVTLAKGKATTLSAASNVTDTAAASHSDRRDATVKTARVVKSKTHAPTGAQRPTGNDR
jgi:choice-of-anchor C domain-containing protein